VRLVPGTTSSIVLGGVGAAVVGGFAAIVSAHISRQIKISEFRQAWINDLRKDIADYTGFAYLWSQKYDELLRYMAADKGIRLREELLPIVNDALVVLRRIRLRFNPRDSNPDKLQDDAFLQSLADLLEPGKLDPDHFLTSWERLADRAVEQAREILKREWEVTKPFPVWSRSRQPLVSGWRKITTSTASIKSTLTTLVVKYKPIGRSEKT
jgi:hypothetical protein